MGIYYVYNVFTCTLFLLFYLYGVIYIETSTSSLGKASVDMRYNDLIGRYLFVIFTSSLLFDFELEFKAKYGDFL